MGEDLCKCLNTYGDSGCLSVCMQFPDTGKEVSWCNIAPAGMMVAFDRL